MLPWNKPLEQKEIDWLLLQTNDHFTCGEIPYDIYVSLGSKCQLIAKWYNGVCTLYLCDKALRLVTSNILSKLLGTEIIAILPRR